MSRSLHSGEKQNYWHRPNKQCAEPRCSCQRRRRGELFQECGARWWGSWPGQCTQKEATNTGNRAQSGQQSRPEGGKRAGSSWSAGPGPQLQETASFLRHLLEVSHYENFKASVGKAGAVGAETLYPLTLKSPLLAGRELLAGHVTRCPSAPRYGCETTRRPEFLAHIHN